MTTKTDKPQAPAAQTQAVARTQAGGAIIQRLKDAISAESVQQQFRIALADSAGPFLASVLELVSSDAALQECDPRLVILEALKAASLKLPINKQFGFAYIVPFSKRPTFMLGYRGLIQLAQRSGQYELLNAGPVYEGMIVQQDHLTGRVVINGERKGDNILGWFAYMRLRNGFEKAIYWTKEACIAHGRKYSKAFDNPRGLWKTNPDAMCAKTPIRDLLGHWGILSTDMQQAMQAEDEADEAGFREERDQNANRIALDISAAKEVLPLASGEAAGAPPVEEEPPF